MSRSLMNTSLLTALMVALMLVIGCRGTASSDIRSELIPGEAIAIVKNHLQFVNSGSTGVNCFFYLTVDRGEKTIITQLQEEMRPNGTWLVWAQQGPLVDPAFKGLRWQVFPYSRSVEFIGLPSGTLLSICG